MPDTTPNLSLPFILPAQAQKHVTHNEALRVLDLVTQLSVASASMTVPPAEIIEGRRYIVPTGATGAWAGRDKQVAILELAAWSFLAPGTGWIAWVEDATEMRIFDGVNWVSSASGSVPSQIAELGIGTDPDVTNKFAVSSAATLFTHAGAGHQIKVNKAAPGDTASLLFQTNWSGRAEMGLAGDDGFAIKVSADGTSFSTALKADPVSGALSFPAPLQLPVQSGAVTPPAAGTIALYAASRAGAGYAEMIRPSGRNFIFQPSFGLNRISTWSPNTGSTVTTVGVPRTITGTTTTPQITATTLAASMRRWRHTSAATAGSLAEERCLQTTCWRGNGPKLGGFTQIARLSLTTVQTDSTGYFGLIGVTTSLGGAATLAGLPACVGIGFARPTDTNWQIIRSDGTTGTVKTDLGAAFAIATLTNVLTVIIHAAPNESSVWVEVTEETSGARVVEELTSAIPSATQLLTPRHYLNNGTTAAAVAYDCSGLYLETDY